MWVQSVGQFSLISRQGPVKGIDVLYENLDQFRIIYRNFLYFIVLACGLRHGPGSGVIVHSILNPSVSAIISCVL